MINRKNTDARAEIRAMLDPIKQALSIEVGKIQAEIRGGTEAVGEARREQAKIIELLISLDLKVSGIDSRLTKLERATQESGSAS